MPTPSKLPRIAVRVTPELDARVADYAAQRQWSYAHTVEQLIMFAHHYTGTDGRLLVRYGRLVGQIIAQHEHTERPVSRVVRVDPLVKKMVELGSDGVELGGRAVSRSAWTSATLQIALDRLERITDERNRRASNA